MWCRPMSLVRASRRAGLTHRQWAACGGSSFRSRQVPACSTYCRSCSAAMTLPNSARPQTESPMCKFVWAATQVPLGAKYNEVIPEHKRFTPQMLIGKLRAEGKEVRLCRCLHTHYVISLNLRFHLLFTSWRLRHLALAVWRLLLAGGPGHRPDKVLAVLQRGGVARGAAPQGAELLLTCLTVLHSGDDAGGQPATQRSHAIHSAQARELRMGQHQMHNECRTGSAHYLA